MIAPVAEVVPVLVATPLPVEKKRRQKSLLRYKRRIGMWLIAPWLVGLILFKLVPILATLVMSFTNMYLLEPFQFKFIGLKNYIDLFADPRLGAAFLGTIKSALILIPIQVLAAVALASLLSGQKLALQKHLAAVVLPAQHHRNVSGLSHVAGLHQPGTGWLYPLFLNPLGLAKYVDFLAVVDAFSFVKLLSSLWSIGPGFLIMMGAMQGIPPEIYEAAMVDGATRLRRFFSITIPMISQAIFFTLILNLTTLFGGTIMTDPGWTFKTDLPRSTLSSMTPCSINSTLDRLPAWPGSSLSSCWRSYCSCSRPRNTGSTSRTRRIEDDSNLARSSSRPAPARAPAHPGSGIS